MKKINYTDAVDIIICDKEFDHIENWNDRFCQWLDDKEIPHFDWDPTDMSEFWKAQGYKVRY